MEKEEDRNFFGSLQKKELQNLCKKYGLSPYKTKPCLVNSLKSYFKALSNGVSEELNCSMHNIQEVSHPKKNKLAIVGEVGMATLPRIQAINVNHDAGPTGNALTDSMKSTRVMPSFEFHVKAEEGIKLFIDLDSSPSDWSKRLENEVCTCQTGQENKIQSFREELELLGNSNKHVKSSFLLNTDKNQKQNDSHVKIVSSLDPVLAENSHVEFDCPDGGDGTLKFTALEPCTDVLETPTPEQKEPLLSSALSFDVSQRMLSGVESFLVDEKPKPLHSDVSTTLQIKSACNSDVTLTSDGLKCLSMLEHQNSRFGGENCENLTLQNSCSPVNINVVCAEYSTIGSLEMQPPEAANLRKDASCSSCNSVCFLDSDDTTNNTLTGYGALDNSSEANLIACGNHMSVCAQISERNNLVNGMETSECLDSNDWVSEAGSTRKRQNGEYHSCSSQPEGKSLRSSNCLSGQVLPRRSMRLVSK